MADAVRIYSEGQPLSHEDCNNLIEFLGLSKHAEDTNIQLIMRLRNIGLKCNFNPPLKISYLPLYIKYLLYDLDFGPVDRLIRKFRKKVVLDYISDFHGYTLLDAGCGRQATLGWCIKSHCKEYIGVDRDIPQVAVQNLKFIKGTIEDVMKDIPRNSLDFITALALIEHLDNPTGFLQLCLETLKPGGYLILTTPPPRSKLILEVVSKIGIISGEEIGDHKTYFDSRTLGFLLEDVGFTVIKKKAFLLGFNVFAVGRK